MADTAERPVFFIHIMKTGGATLRQHVYANFAPGEVFPYKQLDSDMHAANYDVAYLLDLPPERHARIRAYTGHFPFVTTELLSRQPFTFTMLRDPVARSISYLKHCKRYHEQHRDLTLEQIYDDEFFFRCFIDNHQCKIFSMTTDDKLQSYMDWIEIDERRLSMAKANLAKVDLVGVNERYDEFVAEIRRHLGWIFDDLPNRRVAEERWEVDDRLRERITEDNAADLELYRYALELSGERERQRAGP